MRTKMLLVLAPLALLSTLDLQLSAGPIGTAFTYQGRLADSGSPANGNYDLRFTVYDAASGGSAVGGPVTNAAVAVSNGLFSVTLDFGSGVFTGDARWLEIGVRSSGGSEFAALSPRQALASSPYALYAPIAGSAATAGTATTATGVAAGAVGSAGIQNGAIDSSKIAAAAVGASHLAPAVLSNTFWRLAGNAGTAPGAQFLGTTDNQPLELQVNDQRALRLEPNDSGAPSLIGGWSANNVATDVVGAVIAGGGNPGAGVSNWVAGSWSAISGGSGNAISATRSVIAGGVVNTIQGGADYSGIGGGTRNLIQADAQRAHIGGGADNAIGTNAVYANIGGGHLNRIEEDAQGTTVAGGWFNRVEPFANAAAIGGGSYNLIRTNSYSATIAGGSDNRIESFALWATIAGGQSNIVEANAAGAVIPGGYGNRVSGLYGFAAGYRAQAAYPGDFVWADSTDAAFGSTDVNQFLIRASGGVGIGTNAPRSALHVNGIVIAQGFGGNWQEVSGNIAAEPSRAYLINSASEVNVTLPDSPAVGDTIRISGAGAGGWRLTQNASQRIHTRSLGLNGIGTVWTARESQLVLGGSTGVASSADGTKLIAAVYNSQIYTSSDSGVSWTARESTRFWRGVASSADGTKLVAVARFGEIYTSTDSGVSWTSRGSSGDWRGVASSADGTKLIAVVYDGQIYTSTDSGVTWAPRGSIRGWGGVASSADGTKLIAVVYNGQIYTSTDSGGSWTPRESIRNWTGVASSADGTKLVAVPYDGQIYISTDSGASWTPRESIRNWTGVASSADGTKLSAVANNGQIYISTDSGESWVARESNRAWGSIASSADGAKLVAVVADGQIYTSAPTTTTTPGTAGYLTGKQYAAVELQYIGSGNWLPLSYVGEMVPY